MKILKFICLSLLLLIISCNYNEGFDYPQDGGSGDYFYRSTSSYSLPNKNEKIDSIISSGYLNVESNNSYYNISVLPDLGWAYNISAEAIGTIPLSDGQIVIELDIGLSSQYVNDEEFRTIGTKNVALYDTDGSTIIDYVDGYIKGSSLIYEYEALKTSNSEKTITLTEAKQRF